MFFSHKSFQVYVLCSNCVVAGRVLLTGSEEGMVAVSSVSSGLVLRMIQDHRGAPVTDLCVASRALQVCVCVCE